MDPYAELVALAERELEHARAGRWEDLARTSSARVELASTLGAPPASAEPHLRRLLALNERIVPLIASGRAFTGRKLATLRRGQRALSGYGATATVAPAHSRVDGLG
jgi:hypothetical protein